MNPSLQGLDFSRIMSRGSLGENEAGDEDDDESLLLPEDECRGLRLGLEMEDVGVLSINPRYS